MKTLVFWIDADAEREARDFLGWLDLKGYRVDLLSALDGWQPTRCRFQVRCGELTALTIKLEYPQAEEPI